MVTLELREDQAVLIKLITGSRIDALAGMNKIKPLTNNLVKERSDLEELMSDIHKQMQNNKKQTTEGRITLSACITDYLSCANHHADQAANAELAGKHNLYEWHSGAYTAYTIVVHDLQVYEAQEAQLRNEKI